MKVALRPNSAPLLGLTLGRAYVVIGIGADEYRILDDLGRPYLFSPELFEVVDSAEPSSWTTRIGEDGERYSYPAEMNEPGFFEDYFDNDERTRAAFDRLLRDFLREAEESR